MARLTEVPVIPRSPGGLWPVGGAEGYRRFQEIVEQLRARLRGRVMWNVSSTSSGDGGAELLRSFVAHSRGAGIDARWVEIQGPPEFFALAKRLHRALHGVAQAPGTLDPQGRALYEEVLHENALELITFVQPGDLMILHDSQTAGLIPYAVQAGAGVIWRCHNCSDHRSDYAEQAWLFLAPYLALAHAYVFTGSAGIPAVCDPARVEVIPPTLDPFSAKNQELKPETVHAILAHADIVGSPPGAGIPVFLRADSSPGRVDRCATVIRCGPAPAWRTPLVVQVSRWDPLKDPVGVLNGFAGFIERGGESDAELVLAGPDIHHFPIDPESAAAFNEVVAAWSVLPDRQRRRIHIVSIPIADPEENAVIVNALQKHATVVVQKSVCTGFGLSVAEAMWKGRPVVASAVGGIPGQIEEGESGLLIEEPEDLDAFGDALKRILEDPALASALGKAARDRVRRHVLSIRPVERWCAVIERVDAAVAADVI